MPTHLLSKDTCPCYINLCDLWLPQSNISLYTHTHPPINTHTHTYKHTHKHTHTHTVTHTVTHTQSHIHTHIHTRNRYQPLPGRVLQLRKHTNMLSTLFIGVSVCIYKFVCICVCVCDCVCDCMFVCLSVCVWLWLCVWMYVCSTVCDCVFLLLPLHRACNVLQQFMFLKKKN